MDRFFWPSQPLIHQVVEQKRIPPMLRPISIQIERTALIEAHLSRRSTGPLYPHGLVSPIPVDKTQGADPEPGDEYVMWFN